MLSAVIFIFLFRIYSYADESCLTTLRIPINSVPKSIDPHLGNEFDLNSIAMQIFEGLTAFKDGIQPVPSLASWEMINKPAPAIRFKLKKKKFSDGSDVTSLAVVKSLYRSHMKGNQFADLIEGLSNCKQPTGCSSFVIESDNAFVIKLKNNSYELLLRKLASMEGTIVKEHDTDLIGSNAYVIAQKNSDVVLLKRQHNTLKNFSCIKYVKHTPDSAALAYEKGEIDIINSVQFKIPNGVRGQQVPVSFMGTGYIALNFRRPNLSNQKFREAIDLALDREKIAQFIDVYPAGSFITKGLFGHENLKIEHNPQRAKNIIVGEGLAGAKFSLLIADKHKSNTRLFDYIKSAFEAIGLVPQIEFKQFSQMLKDFREDQVDAILKTDSPQNYDATTMFIGLTSSSNSNKSGFSDKVLDDLVIRAKNTPDPSERKKILSQLNRYIFDKRPVITISYNPFKRWIQPWVKVPNLMALGLHIWTLDYANFEVGESKK